MKITQDISPDSTGLKREVEYLSLFNNSQDGSWELQMKVNFYALVNGEKSYLPASKAVTPFKTSNTRRVHVEQDGTLINIQKEEDERWASAIPEPLFWDNLMIAGTMDRSLVLKQFILDLDSERWNWFN